MVVYLKSLVISLSSSGNRRWWRWRRRRRGRWRSWGGSRKWECSSTRDRRGPIKAWCYLASGIQGTRATALEERDKKERTGCFGGCSCRVWPWADWRERWKWWISLFLFCSTKLFIGFMFKRSTWASVPFSTFGASVRNAARTVNSCGSAVESLAGSYV